MKLSSGAPKIAIDFLKSSPLTIGSGGLPFPFSNLSLTDISFNSFTLSFYLVLLLCPHFYQPTIGQYYSMFHYAILSSNGAVSIVSAMN